MKCEMCDQLLQIREPTIDHPTRNRAVCINTRCPNYFEPAARHPDFKPPKCKQCDGRMAQFADSEGVGKTSIRWVCLDPQCPAYEPMTNTPQEIPPTEPARGHGIKLDSGKPLVYTEFLRQFPRAIRLIARVGAAGTNAPGHVRSGWKSVEQGYERYSDAFARHILKEALLATEAEPVSPDPMYDLLWEAATVAWNDLARLEHLIRTNNAAAERLDGDPLA
jgi:hypothetical protein